MIATNLLGGGGGRLQQSDDPSEERETTEKMVHDKVDFNVMLYIALILFSDIFILKRR